MTLQVTHNDMDGIVCHMIIKKFRPNLSYYSTTYNNIQEKLESLHDRLSYDKSIQEVFVTDLSFNQEQFSDLIKIVEEFHIVKFVFIDHHPVLFDIVDSNNLKNLELILDTSMSASKLTAEYFSLSNTFIEAVNAFDTWDNKSKYFRYGFMLNSLFWDYRANSFIAQFKNMQKPSERNLEDFEKIKAKKDQHFQALKNKGLLISSEGVLISFMDKHLNWVQIDYPDEEFYINATSYGTINIRIGDKVPEEKAGELKRILSESLVAEEWFVDIGGHPRAFGIAHNGSNDHLIIVECVKHIVNEISKMKG